MAASRLAEGFALELAPGRSCGECTVCCTVLNLDTPEFQKVPGVSCQHCVDGRGCGIYETRYPACHTYHCAWRYLGRIPDTLRPDRSGVLIEFQMHGLPPHIARRPGIRVTPFRAFTDILEPYFLMYIAKLIETGVPVVLGACGPAGHFPSSAVLNDMLQNAVSRRDLEGVADGLRQAGAMLAQHSFTPVVLEHSGNTNPIPEEHPPQNRL